MCRTDERVALLSAGNRKPPFGQRCVAAVVGREFTLVARAQGECACQGRARTERRQNCPGKGRGSVGKGRGSVGTGRGRLAGSEAAARSKTDGADRPGPFGARVCVARVPEGMRSGGAHARERNGHARERKRHAKNAGVVDPASAGTAAARQWYAVFSSRSVLALMTRFALKVVPVWSAAVHVKASG
jgi:hypothetical protein